MKIVISVSDSDYGTREEMDVNGKDRLYVNPLCECPEDAIIGRSLVSCQKVASFMKEAYEAGKRGEEFSITVTQGEA
jgi:hypothetical protein